MMELWKFYKWAISWKQKNDVIQLSAMFASTLLLLMYVATVVFFSMKGWPVISGLMFLIPLAAVARVAVKKYIAEKGKT